MNRVRVFIATTEGPVAVQKITAEDPDVPSVACRDGTTEVLAISRDYTRFVARGTGLVAALTGHGAYRLDLDRPVDGGRSWQLPVLLAHLLEAEGRLAGPDDPADLALLATGEVDRDRRVRAVGRIAEKLAAAGDLIARHGESGPPLTVLLPEADHAPGIEERVPSGGGGTVRLLAWERVKGLAALQETPVVQPSPGRGAGRESAGTAGHSSEGADPADAADPAHRSRETPGAARDGIRAVHPVTPATGATARDANGAVRRRRPGASRAAGLLLVLLAAVGLGAGAAWWNGPRQWETLRRAGDYEGLERALRQSAIAPLADRYRSGLRAGAPAPESLVFSLVEQRRTDGRRCSGTGSRGAGGATPLSLVETHVPARKPGFFQSERGEGLCRAVYRVANEGEELAYLYFAARPVLASRAGGNGAAAPIRRAAALPPGASIALELEIGRRPSLPLGADLMILAAPSPAPQLREAFDSATKGGDTGAAEAAGAFGLLSLPALGLTVKGASHAILR